MHSTALKCVNFNKFCRGFYFISFERWLSLGISLALHSITFFTAGIMFVKSIEYGVEIGLSSIEVELMVPVSEIKESQVLDKPLAVQEENIFIPVPEKINNQPNVEQSQTFSSSTSEGALSEIKPTYLRNPAPKYPAQARWLGQEGVVVIFVKVGRAGQPLEVSIKQSSGFFLLDDAALKALWRWKFSPAQIGNLPIESNVEIPIRFQLEGI